MLFRGKAPDATVWRRFRSGTDGFTFTQEDGICEAHVAANAERVVDLFYSLSEHLGPAVDVTIDDFRTESSWRGEELALPDVRDAIARLKVPLATYGGVEMSVYTPEDQLTLTAQIELVIYARSDRWAYLLQGKGLEEYSTLADKTWRTSSWDRTPAPALSSAVEAAAQRLSLERTDSGA
jgi:hypothetical protein